MVLVQMKIIAGTFKNRNFYMPADIRPTQNVVRGAVFDMLGPDIKNSSFLDVFSGSGAVGLEALSRGAQSVLCIEREAKNSAIIKENVGILKGAGKHDPTGIFEVWHKDAFASIKKLAAEKRTFDIVFIDPPYSRELAKKALKTLEGYDILHSKSRLIFQHEVSEILPEVAGRIHCLRKRQYGATCLSIYKIET